MTTPTYTPLDIINFAANKDAVNIQTAFDQMVGQKVHAAIQQRKVDIAKSMFVDPTSQEDGEQAQDDTVAGEEEQESEESHEDAEQHA